MSPEVYSGQLPPHHQPDLNTEQAAALLHLRPQTLRKAYSQTGAYFGVRPRKAANGRLFWNVTEILGLKNGGGRSHG